MVRGSSDATTADFNVLVPRGQDDVYQPYLAQLLEYPTRLVAQPGGLRHLMQRLPKDVGQEADQNVSLDSLLGLVPDRADSQVAFVDPERRLGVGQLDVRLPKILGRPVRDIRAEEVAALVERAHCRHASFFRQETTARPSISSTATS